jgi:DNA-binding beta-propeller fold protein YncE
MLSRHGSPADAKAFCRGRTGFYAGLSLILALAVVGLSAQKDVASKSTPPAIRVRATAVIVGPEGDPFTMPSDAAVGPDGRLYVLDGVHHRAVVYDPNGKFLFTFGTQGHELGQFQFPLGIAATGDGKVYIADSGNHRVQVFTADGKPLEAIQLPTAGMKAAPDPTDVAVDLTRAKLYVADNDNHRLCVYDLTRGRFEEDWGGPGLGRRQFRFPFLIDVSTDGYVLVVEPINTRVQVFNSAGKSAGFIGDWGVKPGQLFRPKGVVVCQGQVFVTDSYLGRVQTFDLKGGFLGTLTDREGTPIKLTTPTGITVDAKRRRLYVVELKADRVCRMDLE